MPVFSQKRAFYSKNGAYLISYKNNWVMKFFLSIILTAVLAYVLSLFLPWWTIALAGFVIAFIVNDKAPMSFLSGFLSVFILWGVMAYMMDIQNEHILSSKMGELLGGLSSITLVLVTAFIGALVTGLGALSGVYLRKLLQ